MNPDHYEVDLTNVHFQPLGDVTDFGLDDEWRGYSAQIYNEEMLVFVKSDNVMNYIVPSFRKPSKLPFGSVVIFEVTKNTSLLPLSARGTWQYTNPLTSVSATATDADMDQRAETNRWRVVFDPRQPLTFED